MDASIRDVKKGLLHVHVCRDRAELGQVAAAHAAKALRQAAASAVFASAPSQSETLAALAAEPGIPWDRLTAFHLDEYVGAQPDSPYSFRRFIMDHLLAKVKPARFEGLRGEATDLAAECARYASQWNALRPEVALLGIGENGHIAFNDPPHSRFLESQTVRMVDLTPECRLQQVHDGAFATFDAVPTAALTVSIAAIQAVPALFIMVPGIRKAEAVKAALDGPVSELCPASILRVHPNAMLFLDRESASLLSTSTE